MLENVYDSAIHFLSASSLKETYKAVVEEAINLVNAKYGSIFSLSEDKIKRVYTTSPKLNSIVPRKNGITYSSFKKQKTFVLQSNKIEKIHPEFKKVKAGYDIIIPLSYGKNTIGVLSVISEHDIKFSESDLRRLKYFAPLAALAIKKSQENEQLKRLLRGRDLFISMAAHELKTPLTTLYAYSQLILKKVKSGQNPPLKYIDILISEEQRLTRLIDDLLQVTRTKKGMLTINKTECNLTHLLNQAIFDFKKSYPRHKVNINLDKKSENIIIDADKDKIFQVFLNVLTNSGKFSTSKNPIEVNVIKNKSHVYINFKDQGQGIAKRDLDKIFEPFYRGVNKNSIKKDGLGLGLYLSKNIIEKHKGELIIKSMINKGTTVFIKLPIK